MVCHVFGVQYLGTGLVEGRGVSISPRHFSKFKKN